MSRHLNFLGRLGLLVTLGAIESFAAGPYSKGLNDPTNAYDAPIPGFVGPHGLGKARLPNGQGGYSNSGNVVNPLFFGWAVGSSGYLRSDAEDSFADPTLALGPVTGDNFDVVSLGDLDAAQIAGGEPPGQLILQLSNGARPAPIRDLPGADFVVFENGFVATFNTGGSGTGGVFAELAHVEVSSDGVNFARFPSVSLTPASVGGYGTIDPTNVFNLAGKHVNCYGDSWGTPFDLSALATHPLVVAGTVDLRQIRYVRVVDIPGDGSTLDAALVPHAIFDPWITFGSGGLDLEAVGAISVAMTFAQWQDHKGLAGSQRGPDADPDGDLVCNLLEYAFGMEPLKADAPLAPQMQFADGKLSLRFQRDTRASDVVFEVQTSGDLRQPWNVAAQPDAASILVPVAPFETEITDVSASSIASVGVLRIHRVFAPPGQRFMRVRVALAP